MKKPEDSPVVGHKCCTTTRHLKDMAFFRRKLKAEMRLAERQKRGKGESGEGAIAKLLPLYLKLVVLEQELLTRKESGRKDASKEGAQASHATLSDEDWEILALAVDARKSGAETAAKQY